MSKRLSIRGSTVFILMIIAASAFFYYTSLVDFSNFSYKVRLFPMWTSITLMVLCGLELIFDYIKRKKAEKEGNLPVVSKENKKEALNVFLGFCWMLSIPLGIILFGFYIALPLFVLVFLRANKVGWIPSIIVAAAVLLITFFGFDMALHLRLYPGIIFGGKL